jgi:aryl carrier-like protein
MDPVGATSDLLKMGADSIRITARANRAGIKISAKRLLQHQRNRRTGSKTALH